MVIRPMKALGIACLLAVLSIAGAMPVAAARPAAVPGPMWAVSLWLDSPFIQGGTATPDATASVRQRRAGRTIAQDTTQVNGIGLFYLQVKPLRGGDRLIVKVGLDQRTVIVPDLRLSVDLRTDVVRGRVPAGTATADGYVSTAVGAYEMSADSFSFPTQPDGRFAATVAGGRDITGTDRVYLSWSDPVLRDETRLSFVVPALQVRTGVADVLVFGRGGRRATATMRSRTGTLRARARVTIPRGLESARGTFRRNGSKVKVRAGDVVTLSTSAGRIRLRTPDLVVAGAAGGTLEATCFPSRDFVAGRLGPDGSFDRLTDGRAGSDGSIVAGPLSGTDLPAGTRVMLLCENAAGFTQAMVATVP